MFDFCGNKMDTHTTQYADPFSEINGFFEQYVEDKVVGSVCGGRDGGMPQLMPGCVGGRECGGVQ